MDCWQHLLPFAVDRSFWSAASCRCIQTGRESPHHQLRSALRLDLAVSRGVLHCNWGASLRRATHDPMESGESQFGSVDFTWRYSNAFGHIYGISTFQVPQSFHCNWTHGSQKVCKEFWFWACFGMVQLELQSFFLCKKNVFFLRQRNLLEENRGLWHVPLIFWCLVSASGAAAARQLHWKLALLVAGLSMCAGLLSFFLRRRRQKNLFGTI